jgi:hypothetical protein
MGDEVIIIQGWKRCEELSGFRCPGDGRCADFVYCPIFGGR